MEITREYRQDDNNLLSKIVVIGDAKEDFASKLPVEYFVTGFVSNQKLISLLYNICDTYHESNKSSPKKILKLNIF